MYGCLYLQCYIFIFDVLYFVVTVLSITIHKGNYCIFFFNGLLMLFLYLFNSCIKLMLYDVFQDVPLECFTLIFSRVYNDIKSTSKRDENIMILSVFLRGCRIMTPYFQPSGKSDFSDLCLLVLPLTCRCELTLKSFPREPS